jgi:hypothetical protein
MRVLPLFALAVLASLPLTQHVAAQAVKAPAAPSAGKVGEPAVAEAMTIVYGAYNAQTEVSPWPEKTWGKFPYKSDSAEEIKVHPYYHVSFTENGVAKYLLLTWTRPYGSAATDDEEDAVHACHACGVTIGAAVLRQTDAGWKLEGSNLILELAGAWGEPPKTVLFQPIGPRHYGLILHQDLYWGGTVDRNHEVYLYTGTGFRKLFDTTYEDNADSVFCHERLTKRYHSLGETQAEEVASHLCVTSQETMQFVPAAGSAFDEIRLTRQFPRYKNFGHRRVVLRYRYSKTSQKYRPLQSPK